MKENDIIFMYDPHSAGNEQRFSRNRLGNLLGKAISEMDGDHFDSVTRKNMVKNIINYLWETLK